MITSHEFARRLLSLPDLPIELHRNFPGLEPSEQYVIDKDHINYKKYDLGKSYPGKAIGDDPIMGWTKNYCNWHNSMPKKKAIVLIDTTVKYPTNPM